ncbi:potato inhibitor I family-domain-containing protein [Pelagophyceae sp. CCMP2097]|nr:potato inhibitor I family-domain-containing protein [Pelagophyceae sp. CCMP2097]
MLSRCFVFLALVAVAAEAVQVPIRAMDGEHQVPPDHWQDFVGQSAKDVVAKIQAERPSDQVVAVGQDMMVTMDFRMDRVRVFHDSAGNVVRKPKSG